MCYITSLARSGKTTSPSDGSFVCSDLSLDPAIWLYTSFPIRTLYQKRRGDFWRPHRTHTSSWWSLMKPRKRRSVTWATHTATFIWKTCPGWCLSEHILRRFSIWSSKLVPERDSRSESCIYPQHSVSRHREHKIPCLAKRLISKIFDLTVMCFHLLNLDEIERDLYIYWKF